MPFQKNHPFYPGSQKLFKKGQKPHNFIGRINRSGYWYVYKPDHPLSGKQGYIAEHRLVIEEKIGRHLNPKEAIHHINGIKNDNRIENLKLFATHGQHTKIAHPEVAQAGGEKQRGVKPPNYNRTPHTCEHCGNEFMSNPNRKRRFCTHLCYGESKIGMNLTEGQKKALELGRGWNKGLPMTWVNRPPKA